MNPSTVKTLFSRGDYYEIYFRDNIILRVVRYPADTQIPRDVLFTDLPEPTKHAILNKITDKDE